MPPAPPPARSLETSPTRRPRGGSAPGRAAWGPKKWRQGPKMSEKTVQKSIKSEEQQLYLSIIVRYDDVCEFKGLNNWKKEVQWFGKWFATWKCKTWEPCKISWLKEYKMCVVFRKSSGYTLKTESNRFLEFMFPFPRAKKLRLQGGVSMCDKSNKKATNREHLANLQIHDRFNPMF